MTALLLLIGAALGPYGLAILTPRVLSFLDPAAPVAFAVFGIIAAMRFADDRAPARRLGATTIEAVVTGVLVGAALLAVGQAISPPALFPAWGLCAVVLGIAAANDAPIAIVAGGVLLASMRASEPEASLLLTMQVIAIAALIGASGWLLLARASTKDEQRVTTFASVLLLGGAADYLSMSALFCGAAGGACWTAAGAPVREHLRRDITYVSSSLVALVLLLAGAHAEYSLPALALAAGYAAVCVAGRLMGHRIGARLAPSATQLSETALLSPGVFGVAFALNVVRALGDPFTPLLTIVVVGTVASSLVAAVMRDEALA